MFSELKYDNALFEKDHIDELFTSFLMLCDINEESIKPLNFITYFQSIAIKSELKSSEDDWMQLFWKIDIDKDGVISIVDYVAYIAKYLRHSSNSFYMLPSNKLM
jgi:Ca2+-binding EF-hand superfamily protein